MLGPVITVTGRARKRFGVNFAIKSEWIVNLGPEPLVSEASDVILRHHRESIRAGQKADGSGRQRPLLFEPDPKERRKSKHRGFKLGDFSDSISRGKITLSGPKIGKGGKIIGPKLSIKRGRARPFATRARTSIGATSSGGRADRLGNAGDYVAFVAEERKRGVEYFFVEGEQSRLLNKWLREYMDGAIVGSVSEPKKGDVTARKASQ